MWQKTRVVIGVVIFIFGNLTFHHARANSFSEAEIVFQSGDVTLSGTILIPKGEGQYPALVLVHGAGLGLRESYRKEAEAFASAGILTLFYDKRTRGYSATGAGGRSYALLADDALAAVKTLQARDDVDAVGLWGLSEGAWVAPLAASRSDEVAFLVLVGASSVPPAQQEAWSMENRLRHKGVSGSLLGAMTRSFMRFLVAAELFPEARYDPVPVLEKVHQPVLALWGAMDRTAVPAESAEIMQAALERGGNPHYTITFFPSADHELHQTPDGFLQGEAFAPGYIEKVIAWIYRVALGEMLDSSVAEAPPQERLSPASVIHLPWYESGGWLQLSMFIFLVIAFISYPLIALVRWLRRRKIQQKGIQPTPTFWVARWLVITGLLTVLGLFPYLFTLLVSDLMVGPLFAGRTLPWLVLQLLSLTTLVLTVTLLLTWWSRRGAMPIPEKPRLTLLVMGGLLFILWAFYWNLLMP
jgi:uncharacterized protein